MNAVEAVEQLAEIGRRMQAREIGLQQPLAALHLAGEWEKVLVDPVSALSVLLGNAGAGQVRAENADVETTAGPVAPFRWEEERALAASASLTWRGEVEASRGGETLPAEGVRLARKQASLLGILNANLENRSEGGEHGHAGMPTDPHQGVMRRERRLAAQQEPTVDGREPVGTNEAWIGQDEGVGRATPVVGASVEQPDLRSGLANSRLRQGAPELQADVPATQDGMRNQQGRAWGARRAAPGDGEADGATNTQSNAWVDDSGFGIGPVMRYGYEGVPGDPHMGVMRREGRLATREGLRVEGHERVWVDRVQREWDTTSAAPDDIWAMTGDANGERPLSMAQIEQVLAALDERLELMLLRMYGSAGGLP